MTAEEPEMQKVRRMLTYKRYLEGIETPPVLKCHASRRVNLKKRQQTCVMDRRYASQYALGYWFPPPIESWCVVAPVAVICPRGFLAVLAAVLGTPATTALGELPLEFLPLPAAVVGALADSTPRLVLPAEVPHDDTRPILHISRVVPHRELLNQREDVDIIRKQILIHIIRHVNRRGARPLVQHVDLTVDVEFRDHVGTLEIGPKVAVLRNIGQKLEGHENIFVTRHRRQDRLGGGSVAEVQGIRTRSEGRGGGMVGGLRG